MNGLAPFREQREAGHHIRNGQVQDCIGLYRFVRRRKEEHPPLIKPWDTSSPPMAHNAAIWIWRWG
jgi:hypothetical protein